MSEKTIEEFQKELRERKFKPFTKEEIKARNETPEAKATNTKVVTRSGDRWKTVGAWAFIIFAVSVAVFVWLIYTERVNIASVVCPTVECTEVILNEVGCPENICKLECDCPEFPDEINVKCECGGE